MMRLHQLTSEQIDQWRQARLEAGQAQYSDAHLNRYGLVDIMEEVLDAVNILGLWAERLNKAGFSGKDVTNPDNFVGLLENIIRGIEDVGNWVIELDEYLPDDLCTDERGGNRIWWSEQPRGEGDG